MLTPEDEGVIVRAVAAGMEQASNEIDLVLIVRWLGHLCRSLLPGKVVHGAILAADHPGKHQHQNSVVLGVHFGA